MTAEFLPVINCPACDESVPVPVTARLIPYLVDGHAATVRLTADWSVHECFRAAPAALLGADPHDAGFNEGFEAARQALAEHVRVVEADQAALNDSMKEAAAELEAVKAERDAYRDQSDEDQKARGRLVMELDTLRELASAYLAAWGGGIPKLWLDAFTALGIEPMDDTQAAFDLAPGHDFCSRPLGQTVYVKDCFLAGYRAALIDAADEQERLSTGPRALGNKGVAFKRLLFAEWLRDRARQEDS